MTYWWVALIVALACVLEVAATYLLRKHRKISALIATLIAAFVLIYKSVEYIEYLVTDSHVYPIEFSQISYFCYSVITLAGVKFMMPMAGYFAFATGFGNMLAVLASPDTMVAGFGSWFGLAISLGIHNFLFFGGLLLCCNTVKFSKKTAWTIPAGILLSIAFILLVRANIFYPDIPSTDNVVFLQILDASILEYLMPAEKITTGIRVAWYAGVSALLAGTATGYYALNAVAHRNDAARGDYGWCPGILPVVLYFVRREKQRKK